MNRPDAPRSNVVSTWSRMLFERVPPTARPALAEEVGLAASDLDAGGGSLDYDLAMRIWSVVPEQLDDADVGLHFAEGITVSSLGIIGYFAAASADVASALRRATAYHRLFKEDGSVIELTSSKDWLSVAELPPPAAPPWPRHLAEAVIATYVMLARAWTGEPVVATNVELQHEAPASLREHQRILGCTPVFSAQSNRVTFDRAVGDLPLRGADETLSQYLALVADDHLRHLPASDALIGDVRRIVLAALPDGAPDMASVAKALGMGSRTLQRKLLALGTQFHTIVDQIRRDAAARLLSDERLSVLEVAFLLGFSEVRSLNRAHRRWTGRPPRGRPRAP